MLAAQHRGQCTGVDTVVFCQREGVCSSKQGRVPFFKDFFPASQVGVLHGMSSRFEGKELPKVESSWTTGARHSSPAQAAGE